MRDKASHRVPDKEEGRRATRVGIAPLQIKHTACHECHLAGEQAACVGKQVMSKSRKAQRVVLTVESRKLLLKVERIPVQHSCAARGCCVVLLSRF